MSPPPPYRFRPAADADAQTLADFNVAMALETEQLRLDPPTVLAGVRALLADPAKGSYFVAEGAEERVLGCLMITHEWSDWRNGDLWWIQSVYVHPAHRRRGVFRGLYTDVADRARAAKARGLRLYVERDNRIAQNTYRALGMGLTHYAVMEQMF